MANSTLTPGTENRMQILFREEDWAEASRLLLEECGNNLPFLEDATPESLERFRFAALKVSRGDLTELRKAVELAKLDWRDLLMSANFGRDGHAHEHWMPEPRPKSSSVRIGVFAYGSILTDPSPEFEAATESFLAADSPFPVEYARYSSSRGNAPTLVPVLPPAGGQVHGRILLLRPSVSLEEAKSMLWRRETRKEEKKVFTPGSSPNSVQIAVSENFCGVDLVLHTDFLPEGKVVRPDPRELARHAISSAKRAQRGKDGISYLIGNIEAGILTPLTEPYKEEIFRMTAARTLQEALEFARTR
jgi:hypothetical protein